MLLSTWQNGLTFLDNILVLDCINSLFHGYLMLTFMTRTSTNPVYCAIHVGIVSIINNLDRVVPFTVGFYRFCLTTLSLRFFLNEEKKRLELISCFILVALPAISFTKDILLLQHNKFYFECVEREETFYYGHEHLLTNPDFGAIIFNIPLNPLYKANSFLVVSTFLCIPLFYICIMFTRFSSDRKVRGFITNQEFRKRRKANLLSAGYNFTNWLAALIASVVAVMFRINRKTSILYIFVQGCISPVLYYWSWSEKRARAQQKMKMCVVNCLMKMKAKFTLSSQGFEIQGIEVEEAQGGLSGIGGKGGQIFEETKRKSEIEGVGRELVVTGTVRARKKILNKHVTREPTGAGVMKKNREGPEDNVKRNDEEFSRRTVAKKVMRQPLAEVTD
ncbi:uncharacterized protein LOC111711115 isoform X2 [Eurytemora carolleeae]|nr:uncharacterized protein LOC111711115 isoform X2 [Eurytemora carolleeae]|eukprot:XP_023341138.1 uncharacterized protein LOC111711115 isoform X2 [Eurytemora affinis]